MTRNVSKHRFIERSLESALLFFKEAAFSEDRARSKGLLQSTDPRVKIVLLTALVIVACLVHTITAISLLYAVSLLLAVASGIPLFSFIARVWFFIPLFTAVIAIPAAFIQGLLPACIFTLRVATCVSFVVLITMTTTHNRLFGSLRALGIPAIFVQILDMTYRYIALFVQAFEEMHRALKARLVRSMAPASGRSWIASRIGYLFRRSVRMSEDVYMAMIARGYTGDMKDYGG